MYSSRRSWRQSACALQGVPVLRIRLAVPPPCATNQSPSPHPRCRRGGQAAADTAGAGSGGPGWREAVGGGRVPPAAQDVAAQWRPRHARPDGGLHVTIWRGMITAAGFPVAFHIARITCKLLRLPLPKEFRPTRLQPPPKASVGGHQRRGLGGTRGRRYPCQRSLALCWAVWRPQRPLWRKPTGQPILHPMQAWAPMRSCAGPLSELQAVNGRGGGVHAFVRPPPGPRSHRFAALGPLKRGGARWRSRTPTMTQR